MAKRIKKQAKSRLLKVEALEQRQLLAGGFTSAQGQEFADITHPNGNVYDQILLKSAAINVINDPGQITRISFLDQQGDIVQVEFGGAGTLSLSLDASTFKSGVAPDKYLQSGVTYVEGLASVTISGSDATTNLNIFTVGSTTAINQSLFDSTHTGGNNMAEVQRVTVVANPAFPNGSTFGSIFAGNVNFSGTAGPVGITAANVQLQGVVNIGDINASGTGIPSLIFGTSSQFGVVNITGGDLLSPNAAPINNNGSYLYTINLTAGTLSNGTADAAENSYSQMSFTGQNPVTATTKVFALTTSVDTIVGTSGNDSINAQLGGVGGSTLSALDNIDGAGGNDTLSINDVAGNTPFPAGLTIKNVETITLASAGIAKIDTSSSSITGVTALNVLSSTGDDLITAGAGQAVTVFDTKGLVTVAGGSSQTVTTTGGVALSGATGAVSATDLNQGIALSTIDGGTTVNLTNTASATGADTGTITIGATKAPTGAITVSDTITGDKGFDRTAGAVAITGGSSVSVTISGSQGVNANGTANETLTLPGVTINGTSTTTSVTVSGEVKAVTETKGVTAVAAVAGTTETNKVQFVAINAAETIILAGVTYTAPTGGASAKQVAAAFASLGSQSGITGWTTGAVSGAGSDTVTFTSTTADTDVADVADTGTGANPTVTETKGAAGTAATAAVTAKGGLAPSAIAITDANGGASSATITTVSLTDYAANATISSGALANLSLAGAGGNVTITNAAAKTLDLTLSGTTVGTLTSPTYTKINAHLAGDATVTTLTAAAVTDLTVDGTKALTITNAVPATLKTVTVSGSAGFTASATLVGTAVTDVNAAATSGAVTVTIDPTATTFEGGSGVDTVTVSANATKAIDGGAGTDVLTLAFAGGYASNAKVTGFETLGLGTAADANNYDATGFTALRAGALAGNAVFTNVAAGAGLTITGSTTNTLTYTLKDATGTSDAVTITTNGTDLLATPGVESVTIAATGGTTTLTLTDAALKTVTITGSKDVTWTNNANLATTTVDASALTGKLTYTTAGTVAEVVTGGTKDDTLVAKGGGTQMADTLSGGAGNDTLTSNGALTVLTGGSGNDTFVIQTLSGNVNTFTTVTDASAGDVLKLVNMGNETFNKTKLVLGDTAVFQDYANAVVQAGGDASGNGYIGWFQFNGNTYIVESMHDGSGAGASFQNGIDLVVKINGLVDLSTWDLVQSGGNPVIVVR